MGRIFFIFIFLILINSFVFTQNFEYRQEESSIISWNGINIFDARQLGTGDVSFFFSEPFSGINNPALISVEDPAIGFNISMLYYDSFQFRGINEGVKTTSSPLTGNYRNINSFAIAFKLSILKINLGWYVSDLLRFPSFEFRNEYNYNQYDYYKGLFSGKKNNFFSAISFDINNKLTLGLTANYITGNRNVTLTQYSSYNYTINGSTSLIDKYTESVETNKIRQFIPAIGLQYKIRQDLSLSIAVKYPITGRVDREIKRSFVNDRLNINLTNTTSITDSYYSPGNILLGIKKVFKIKNNSTVNKKKLTMALESKLMLWSDYKYILYGEDIIRDMKNTIVTGIGLEYGVYSNKKDLFFRTGFKLDPQPLKISNTILKTFSCGLGIRLGKFSGDIGAAYWFGSSNGINRNDLIISSNLTYNLRRKK